MRRTVIDQKLYQFCTVRQLEMLEAIAEHGSMRAAGRALGVNFRSVHQAYESVRRKAALALYSPEHHLTHPLAPGLKARGTSQLFRKGEEEPLLTWVKSSADDQQRMEILREAAAAMAEEIERVQPMPGPTDYAEHLCNVYTITDAHVGMLAWGEETGDDWDLKIAEDTLVGCFAAMIEASPRAAVGFLNQLGDYLHYDSATAPVTPTSGHALDADGRMPKMVRSAVRILRRVLDMVLQRHDRAVVLLGEGNHDIAGSVWLRVMFAALYENEPRVTVIDSEYPYYTYQHGKTLLAFHHGHLKKNDSLPLLFASQFPKQWGSSEKRYCHTGHRHHVEEKEHSGMTVLQHPTLAAKDAYAARHGWLANRQVTAITYHAKFGEVARNTVCPEMLDAA